ncbi:uncharacterized protein NECHADRAFT_81272 [Fusarium vanettenii 77-13-4]|uniref:BTB domain-containing protein n=1 Tax=Fusarium vanettenii (strain ATCC MYA-4622 / CBS 123669 / FGSC 9596 / NRRL 45880 / 77-13-4) TaxID=660122 RepID=C7ZHR2_FUSV7|nr:uncharacterized protein NECHADRAFT_81272 [Fusarium vanettenii 77-13-4]EEU36559.1 hypothetical protein NECHADRAFT_81272 [Fusarium vanettenii 77-13-4]
MFGPKPPTSRISIPFLHLPTRNHSITLFAAGMSATHVDIDPEGDILIILLHDKPEPDPEEENGEEPAVEKPEPEKTDGEKADDEMTDVEEPNPQTCFKVSMKHLILASPRAKKMFEGNYTEARPDADGLRRWKFEPIFDPAAFEIVMNAIHGYTHKMPRTVTLENLAKIAAIVDDLDCAQSLWFFAKTWIAGLDKYMRNENFRWWIVISFVFDEPDIFRPATQLAILQDKAQFDAQGLPIRPKIIGTITGRDSMQFCLTLQIDTMDAEREKHIKRIVIGVASLVRKVQMQTCDPQCKSMTFGALTLHLMSLNLIFPSPSEPYLGMSLNILFYQLRIFQLPSVYRPGESFKEHMTRSKDLWLFQQAMAPGGKRQRQPDGADTHSCDLRDLVAKSLSSLLITVPGLKLSDFR